MNVQPLSVDREAAKAALLEYKQHRAVYDQRDWEIERIYRQIAKGKTAISINDAIPRGGLDDLGRPKLAIMRADQQWVRCETWRSENVIFSNPATHSRAAEWYFDIPWTGRPKTPFQAWTAALPRIPPQHRPSRGDLSKYHILWEADWTSIPRDPMLLKRIGKDAWLVCAAWDLTDVEMSVLRSHPNLRPNA